MIDPLDCGVKRVCTFIMEHVKEGMATLNTTQYPELVNSLLPFLDFLIAVSKMSRQLMCFYKAAFRLLTFVLIFSLTELTSHATFKFHLRKVLLDAPIVELHGSWQLVMLY